MTALGIDLLHHSGESPWWVHDYSNEQNTNVS